MIGMEERKRAVERTMRVRERREFWADVYRAAVGFGLIVLTVAVLVMWR